MEKSKRKEKQSIRQTPNTRNDEAIHTQANMFENLTIFSQHTHTHTRVFSISLNFHHMF